MNQSHRSNVQAFGEHMDLRVGHASGPEVFAGSTRFNPADLYRRTIAEEYPAGYTH